MLPVDVAATAVKGPVGIGITAEMVVGVDAGTVEEDVEKGEEVVGMVWEDLVKVAVVVGVVENDVGVTEEDVGSTCLKRKRETVAEVVVTVIKGWPLQDYSI